MGSWSWIRATARFSTQDGSTSAQQLQFSNPSQRMFFLFFPSFFALSQRVCDRKRFNRMASFWCCDETMGNGREMRSLDRTSCSPQFPPNFPALVHSVSLGSCWPVHYTQMKAIQWNRSKSCFCAADCNIFPVGISTDKRMLRSMHESITIIP